MKLVVNASPLILLVAADQLTLLPQLAEEIVIPEAVLFELRAGGARDHAAARVEKATWATVGSPLPITPALAGWDLGSGETGVLSWAERHEGFTCVLDDRAARSYASTTGLPCVGTLGLVITAKEAGLIPAARPILEQMRQAGFYLADAILEHGLRSVGE